jgi:hypothetical protein
VCALFEYEDEDADEKRGVCPRIPGGKGLAALQIISPPWRIALPITSSFRVLEAKGLEECTWRFGVC